jgi:ribosomal protein L29
MSNKAMNDLIKKSSDELAILALRLKLQLMQERFLKASGNEKKINVKQIKKMIAHILTVLSSRQLKLSLGTHGVSLIDLKTNKQTSLNKLANSVISQAEKELIKDNNQFGINETKAEKHLDNLEKKLVEKPVLKSQTDNKQKNQVIHKTSGNSGI